MTSLKQIEANRLNSGKSTGPRTLPGKLRSRHNALRHGLTAETVIGAFESATDYQAFASGIEADYQPRTAVERELVSRLVSALWRLRRATAIETGLMQIQAGLLDVKPRGPEWLDELDAAAAARASNRQRQDSPAEVPDSAVAAAYCFLSACRAPCGALDILSRYEKHLWRQAAQIIFMLQSRKRA